jgi:hypothetical protein
LTRKLGLKIVNDRMAPVLAHRAAIVRAATADSFSMVQKPAMRSTASLAIGVGPAAVSS